MIIKSIARRNWPSDARPYSTWYEPFDDQEQITAAVAWVLSRPEVTGIATAGEVRLFGKLVRAERDRAELDPAQVDDVLARAAGYSSPFEAMPF